MLQRIQSVYLALVAICMMALYFTSVATFSNSSHIYIYSIFGLNMQGSNNLDIGMFPTFLLGLTTTTFLLSIYNISLFKTRVKQMTFVRLNSLLILFFIVLAVLAFNKSEEIIKAGLHNELNTLNRNFLFGSTTPFIALVLNVLAYRGIKKDEALVRSADRIR
jgi:glucan phosphoethanolaminetransferase (alkaline phosphatase superfamily)